jgi:hypothetical protein
MVFAFLFISDALKQRHALKRNVLVMGLCVENKVELFRFCKFEKRTLNFCDDGNI